METDIFNEKETLPLICDMDANERPREKALEHGLDALTDAELMAIIFATGVRGKSVLQLCQEILDDHFNHLSFVARMSVADFVETYKGIGKVKALTLLAALQLGQRAERDSLKLATAQSVTTSTAAASLMRNHFKLLEHEEFWVLYLNRAGFPLRKYRVSMGGTCATTVDVKLIIRVALDCLASSMILFHNHPSGSTRPSPEDESLTTKIVDAAAFFDIRVLDHIILTDGSHYSFRDYGRI